MKGRNGSKGGRGLCLKVPRAVWGRTQVGPSLILLDCPAPGVYFWNREVNVFLFFFSQHSISDSERGPELLSKTIANVACFLFLLLLISSSLIYNLRDSTVSISFFGLIKRHNRRYECQILSRLKHSC